MEGQVTKVPENDELATITEYLLNGGTLAEAKSFSKGALESIYSMSYNQYQSGRYEKAARGFQYLCFYDHWNPRNFLCLGACQQMLRLYGDALKTYEYAARMDKKNPLPKVYMGDCYLALRDEHRARIVYESAIKDADTNHISHAELTRIKNLLATLFDHEGGKH
ncbi:CesD/SycD/LcrH family type III secretion system chaperone [Endozoicomonas sp. OPT23]|uniref:SycD/LcrH family type III secretion system chaperone n=1 Tax=Endozoicomonas sp. OPT23 TaxID=2072845 RepID=UPI00129A247D|nr:SycD/LcrH family type III secretion system chaperone [Endozoicomonas sp. OPT23]MRI32763.1 CesD/SycD/LcrH family type III secretion system chaperone [Endozoicomonas sp. OPT23]